MKKKRNGNNKCMNMKRNLGNDGKMRTPNGIKETRKNGEEMKRSKDRSLSGGKGTKKTKKQLKWNKGNSKEKWKSKWRRIKATNKTTTSNNANANETKKKRRDEGNEYEHQ